MANLNGFDANQHESMTFDPVPDDDYVAMIVNSEMKPTRTGGEMLKLEVDIIEGKYKGRKVFENLNLINSNAEAVRIAESKLADICRAVNVLHPRDSAELHNKPLRIRTSIEPAQNGYDASNKIKRWMPVAKVGEKAEEPVNVTLGAPVNKKPWE